MHFNQCTGCAVRLYRYYAQRHLPQHFIVCTGNGCDECVAPLETKRYPQGFIRLSRHRGPLREQVTLYPSCVTVLIQ
jgi:hypothetical protein